MGFQAIDEGASLGCQLRTNSLGSIDNADFYYFGGMRVYRSKILTKKDLSGLVFIS